MFIYMNSKALTASIVSSIASVTAIVGGVMGYKLVEKWDHDLDRDLRRQEKKLPSYAVWKTQQSAELLKEQDDYDAYVKARADRKSAEAKAKEQAAAGAATS
jgi:hypothetical protein